MKHFFCLAALICFPARAYELHGRLYEKDTDRKVLLYEWQRTEKVSGPMTEIRGIFSAPDKTVAVEERATVREGKLEKYSIQHNQLKQNAEVVVREGKLHFSLTRDGKTQTSEEDWEPNFVVAPTLVDYLGKNRDTLLQGGTVRVRYGVLDRTETIGFSFDKVEEKKVGGIDAIVVKMRPSSLFLSALVSPIFLTLRKDTFRSMELVGRTLPKRRVGDDWKDLDCEIVYQ